MKILSAEEFQEELRKFERWIDARGKFGLIFSNEVVVELLENAKVPLPPSPVRLKLHYEDQFCKEPGKPDHAKPDDGWLFAEVSRIEALGYMLNSAAEKAELMSSIDARLHRRSPRKTSKILKNLAAACVTIKDAYANDEVRRLLENSATRCHQEQLDIRAKNQQEITALRNVERTKRAEALTFPAGSDERKHLVADVKTIKDKRETLEAKIPMPYDHILALPDFAAASGAIVLCQTIKAIENFKYWADAAAMKADEPDTLKMEWFEGKGGSRGTVPEFKVQRFVGSLCEIWQVIFERRPTTSVNWETSESYGQFITFIRGALSALGIVKTDHAIRERVRSCIGKGGVNSKEK